MTAPATTAHPVPAPEARDEIADVTPDEGRCGSCPHPLAAHDPIGLRFCRATRAGGISRGCVCRTA
ncbi:RGCVC family protein [Modestobacter lapidis]|nr:hypothetical protein [Modestobacter lapidis]